MYYGSGVETPVPTSKTKPKKYRADCNVLPASFITKFRNVYVPPTKNDNKVERGGPPFLTIRTVLFGKKQRTFICPLLPCVVLKNSSLGEKAGVAPGRTEILQIKVQSK